MYKRFLIAAALALSACSQPAPPEAENTPAAEPAPVAALPTDSWVQKWTGVEGTSLTISKTAMAGAYHIEEVTLDGPKTFAGTAEGDQINFVDGGKLYTITAGNGADTGMKYLATKSDCLVVEFGSRGFCRD